MATHEPYETRIPYRIRNGKTANGSEGSTRKEQGSADTFYSRSHQGPKYAVLREPETDVRVLAAKDTGSDISERIRRIKDALRIPPSPLDINTESLGVKKKK